MNISSTECILHILNQFKFVDLYKNLDDTEAIEESWRERDDLYSENRAWDKNSVLAITGILGNLNNKIGLDIGCGGGQKTTLLVKGSAQIVVTDISANAIKKSIIRGNKENISIVGVQCSGDNLPFKENVFDYLICNEVIEHIPNDEGVLREAKRVIKTNGIVTIGLPNIYDLRTFFLDFVYLVVKGVLFKILRRGYVGPFRAHVHLYTYNSFSKLSMSSGLKINKVVPVYSPIKDTYSWMGGYFKKFPTRDTNIFLTKIINLLIFAYPKYSLYTYVFCLRKQ